MTRGSIYGLLGRNGKVRAKVLKDRNRDTLFGEIHAHVAPGTEVITDEYSSYRALKEQGTYIHNVINHAEKYVEGHVHTNGIENFWSLLKRSIKGTYVSVEPFHLFRYLDEQTFRFNERKDKDADRFVKTVKQIAGKRLTYDELTGGGREGH